MVGRAPGRVRQAFGALARGIWRPLQRWRVGSAAVLELVIDEVEEPGAFDALLRQLRRAGADPAVRGVLLLVTGSPGGWAAAEALRDVIVDLRATGTRVTVWLEAADNVTTWIGSAADDLLLPPMGELSIGPVQAELVFFRGLMEHVGVEADVVAAGAYKSLGEPFLRRHASPENLEATKALVGGLQEAVVRGLMDGRRLPEAAARQAVADGPLAPEDAVERGLIDGIAYEDEARERAIAAAGEEADLVDFERWARLDGRIERSRSWGRRDCVAVVHLAGGVVMEDEPGRTSIAARSVVPLLDALREDASIVGVVLAVDSPGGSAFASDLIWRAVARLAAERPVVACYGDVSASGGVYLAAPAVEVFARGTSLTGSIGVVAGKVALAPALRRVGVTTQQVRAGDGPVAGSSFQPFNPGERARLTALLDRFYHGFVQRVADGRGRSWDEVEPYCRGRVWTGAQAQAVGLVDRIGGIDDGVAAVVARAELAPGTWRRADVVPGSESPLRWVIRELARRYLPFAATWGRAVGAAELMYRLPGRALMVMPGAWKIR